MPDKNKKISLLLLNITAVCSFFVYSLLSVRAESPDGADTVKSQVKAEPWILQQSDELYTVQVSAFNNKVSALHFIAANRLQNDVALFKANSGGKVWYKAIYKTFTKRRDAVRAKEDLARRIPEQAPWLRRFADIHREIHGIEAAPLHPALVNPLTADELRRGQSAFIRQDYAKARAIWMPLAVRGSAEAQYGLGFMYESGWGVKRDYAKAFEWYEKAAIQGHVKSQYNLGLLYLNGFGVAKDKEKGRYWVQSAATHNDARALEFLKKNPMRDGS